MKLLAFGEVLWDVIDGVEHLGGAPFNVAAHFAKCGGEVTICTRVGDDDRGRRVLAEMDRLSIDRSLTTVDSVHPTGWVSVTLDQGQPTYVIHENVAWDFIEPPANDRAIAGDVIVFGMLAQRSDTSRRALGSLFARTPLVPKLLDVNLRQQYYSATVLSQSLFEAWILKLNAEEVAVLGPILYGESLSIENFARRVADNYGLEIVLVTLGADGCAVLHEDRFECVPAPLVTVADTVGAGDAFTAAFLYSYLRGESVVEAVLKANRLGAYVASQHGAIPEYDAAKILAEAPAS